MPKSIFDTPADPTRPAQSLAEMLAFDDVEFITNAYVTILGRLPDGDGEAYYLDRLRSGHSKKSIVRQFRKSREARQRTLSIPNFDQDIADPIESLKAAFAGLGSGFRVARRRAGQSLVSTSQLMAYHDEEFVRVLYRFYLDREPDAEGLAGNVARLRSGFARQQILLDIAGSPEARLLGRTARGQGRLALFVALTRIPLLGGLIEATTLLWRIRLFKRDLRALQNRVYRNSLQIETGRKS